MASVLTPPSMPLGEFPTEILNAIFSCIPNRGCLTQLMRVCRRFRDVIEPILYRSMHLQVSWTPPSRDSQGHINNRGHLAWFVDALSARPQHSRHVKGLYLQLDNPKDLDPSYKIKLSNGFPHLHELSISPPSEHLDLTGMLDLEYLRLDFDSMSSCSQPVQFLLNHSYIPTLRILQIEWLELDSPWGYLDPPERQQTSPIIDLRIHVCAYEDQSAGIVTCLLNHVQSLKRFSLDVELDAVIAHVVTDWLSWDEVLGALRVHADTLEDILVAASDGGFIRRTTPSYSIMTFSSLKKLAIPIQCLEYCDDSSLRFAIPPTLEELQLQQQECGKDVPPWYACYEGLKALVESKCDGFPKLKLIVWWTQMSIAWFQGCKRWPVPPIETLVLSFQEVGVVFSWVITPNFIESPFGQVFKPLTVAGEIMT